MSGDPDKDKATVQYNTGPGIYDYIKIFSN